jgi:hypothetical protein
MFEPRVAAYVLAAASADGSNDAGGMLGVGDPLDAGADDAGADAAGADAAGADAAGAVVALLLQAAKTMPAVASNAPARMIPNFDRCLTRGLLSS